MQRKHYAVSAGIMSLALAGLAGCFSEPPGWGPARQAHEQREFRYGPKHEVCDPNGNHCMVCDADNDYCRRLPSYSAPYSYYSPYDD
jgi:hypothetical protein